MTRHTATKRTVYFARPLGKIEPIKIGCSQNVETRLQQLRPIAKSQLELLTAIPGSMDDERRIHSVFRDDHIGGEWFRWSRSLQSLIDTAKYGGFDFDTLPPSRPIPSLNKRHSWTEDQKLRARLNRQIKKAEKKTGRRFSHDIGMHDLRHTWKSLIPEIERFLEAAA